jgi:flagellar protein FliT
MPPDDGQVANTERWSMIPHYEAIAGASRRMLEAARADDWDAVTREEARCRELITVLKGAQRSGDATDPAVLALRRQRLTLLRAVLADDAEIRELSEPWLKQLEALLSGRTRGHAAGR